MYELETGYKVPPVEVRLVMRMDWDEGVRGRNCVVATGVMEVMYGARKRVAETSGAGETICLLKWRHSAETGGAMEMVHVPDWDHEAEMVHVPAWDHAAEVTRPTMWIVPDTGS